MAVVVDKETCVGCGACVDTCPVNALSMDNNKVKVNDETCVNCGACIGNCPVEALTL